jgi:hypothetical protein
MLRNCFSNMYTSENLQLGKSALARYVTLKQTVQAAQVHMHCRHAVSVNHGPDDRAC